LSAFVHGTGKHHGFSVHMLKAALLFFMMRICNRSCYTIVRDPVQQFKLHSGLLKNTVRWLKMDSQSQLKSSSANPKMLWFLLLHHLYPSLHKCKADNTCLSNTIANVIAHIRSAIPWSIKLFFA
jgi:hypothetical protein